MGMTVPSPHIVQGAKPSEREMDALAEYVLTASHKEAARNLDMAESTVKNHLVNLRAKTGTLTTFQLVYVLRRELQEHPRLVGWTPSA